MTIPSWSNVATCAKQAGAKFPELACAQFAVESAWGHKVSGKNNYFGIKGKGTKCKTTEFINGKEEVIYDEFKDFDSLQDCVNYLVEKWYKDYKEYKGINRATTREEAAFLLVSEGYCTDPRYAEKLIGIMNKNSAPRTTVSGTAIKLTDAAEYFQELEHQINAWNYLQQNTDPKVLAEFTRMYRANPGAHGSGIKLNVPYYYQRDSKTGHGERSCQASAIAMALEYINADLIRDDDDYLKLVFKYGDTVSQSAHQKALAELGVKNRFSTTGSEGDLIRILSSGYPVPIGILHRGSLGNPTGGGHYITLIGYDRNNFFVHDPFGELDLVNGGYPKAGPNDGKGRTYSRANLMRRWLITNKNDGWYWDFSANKIV